MATGAGLAWLDLGLGLHGVSTQDKGGGMFFFFVIFGMDCCVAIAFVHRTDGWMEGGGDDEVERWWHTVLSCFDVY